jgi:hypothetical protein
MKARTHAVVVAPTPATAAARSRPTLATRSDVIAAPPTVAAPIADRPIAAAVPTPVAVIARPGHQIGRYSIHPPLPAGVQAKLTVSQPEDTYEQEADRVADAVMRMTGSIAPASPPSDGNTQSGAVWGCGHRACPLHPGFSARRMSPPRRFWSSRSRRLRMFFKLNR